MFSIRRKVKVLLAVATTVCVIYLVTITPKLWRYKEKTRLIDLRVIHVYGRETADKHKRQSKKWREKDESEGHGQILTDTLLNIERDGDFPEDDPCPYLGVRKPIRDGRYQNDYYGVTCKPHRPNVKACEQAYDIFGSASELPIEECSETKYEELCTFRAGKNPQTHHLECDWSICFPRRPYIGEVNSTYGIVVRWRYSPSRVMIKEIITRSIKNGFYFVFFKCGGLKQVLKLPHRPKMSPSRKGSKRINVNLILIDSISRPHFYRSMPRSIEALRHVVYNRSIPATVLDFELLQSVSQHTMDNCRPLYSGVTAGVYKEFSSKWRKSIKSLGIPVLFGEYKKAGYQTLFQEEGCWYDHWGLMLTDVERYATPNSKAGFAKRWKELQERWRSYFIDDFGLTHFTCEIVKKYGLTNDLDIPAQVCLNGDFVSTYYLKYHLDYLKFIQEHPDSSPLLHYFHLITGHTTSGVRIRNDDLGLADYIMQVSRDPNTLTIFLSDHGHTRTAYAKTVEGRFELSNPFMFAILPEDVAKVLGTNKVRSLLENQRRLFTTLDIHRMLMALNNPDKLRSEDYQVNGILSMLPSNRTCESLPLTPLTRCKCEGWDQKVEDNAQRHIWLAEFAIGQLNNRMQEQFMKGKNAKSSGGYGACLRLRGMETKNNLEKQTDARLGITMDLLVESVLPNMAEVFQVLIETSIIPNEKIAVAEFIKFDRHTLYNRYEHCVDDGVDIRLCTCATKLSDGATITSEHLRSLATRDMFGVKTQVTSLDKDGGCLLLLSRQHNFSIAYEVANLCEKTYNFRFHGETYNVILTAKLPLDIVLKPKTIHFLLSATRYVVNDSYFDIKTHFKLVKYSNS